MTPRPTLVWICAANFPCLSFEYFAGAARTNKRGSRENIRVGEPMMAASGSTSMNKTLKTLATLGWAWCCSASCVVVINQTAGVVQLAKEVDPTLGTATLWGLLIAYGGLIGVPVVIIDADAPAAGAPRERDRPGIRRSSQAAGRATGGQPASSARRDPADGSPGRRRRASACLTTTPTRSSSKWRRPSS